MKFAFRQSIRSKFYSIEQQIVGGSAPH
jgi:hypothetical protein